MGNLPPLKFRSGYATDRSATWRVFPRHRVDGILPGDSACCRQECTGIMMMLILHLQLQQHHSLSRYVTVDSLQRTSLTISRMLHPRQLRFGYNMRFEMAQWRSGKVLDLRSWVQFSLKQSYVTTLGKLFTPMCLCNRAVW